VEEPEETFSPFSLTATESAAAEDCCEVVCEDMFEGRGVLRLRLRCIKRETVESLFGGASLSYGEKINKGKEDRRGNDMMYRLSDLRWKTIARRVDGARGNGFAVRKARLIEAWVRFGGSTRA